MSLAIIGIIACGNCSNLIMILGVPDLFLNAMPGVVPTSAFTSVGLILFCSYEILILLRPTPNSYFIVDDILLHLALFPGGLSLLGHLLNSPTYLSSSVDPRVGIGIFEIFLMGTYAVSAVLENPNLFLWKFLQRSWNNRIIFLTLFINQYVAPVSVALWLFDSKRPDGFGVEFFVMLAGVMATLVFLILQAFIWQRRDFETSSQR